MESNCSKLVDIFPSYLFVPDLVDKIPDQQPLLLKNHLQRTNIIKNYLTGNEVKSAGFKSIDLISSHALRPR
jgi:hypothetical protein